MDSKTIIFILIAIMSLVAIINILYQTDDKKREGFVHILVLLVLGSMYLVLVNKLDITDNKLVKKFSGWILFFVFMIFSFIYGYRKR